MAARRVIIGAALAAALSAATVGVQAGWVGAAMEGGSTPSVTDVVAGSSWYSVRPVPAGLAWPAAPHAPRRPAHRAGRTRPA